MTTNGNGNDNGAYSETDIIQTTDEEGQIHVFEKISEFEMDDQEYALLIYRGNEYDENAEPAEDDEEEVVVMKVSYEDGQEVFEAIEDEEEFERVVSFIETMDDGDEDVTIDLGELLSHISDDDEEEKN